MRTLIFSLLLGFPAFAQNAAPSRPVVDDYSVGLVPVERPAARSADVPRARWEHRNGGMLWTRVALSAVQTHGAPLTKTVPKDIAEWCPAYPDHDTPERAAFWAALLSTLSRYESTWKPTAVGGNGRWFGLMQIYPPTAEFRNCRVQTGTGLKSAAANLNCAVRIMAITVPRDEAISVKDTRWRGVAADWGPIRTDWMRRDMQRYTKRQPYCRLLSEVRPRTRPAQVQ
ncbi:MAG: transglycosylase SLT domain-containing protein [Paracoccaceae bacterium]